MTFAPRQFLFLRFDTSPTSFKIQNKIIETPGAKIRENFGKSKRPTPGAGGVGGGGSGARDCHPPAPPPDVPSCPSNLRSHLTDHYPGRALTYQAENKPLSFLLDPPLSSPPPPSTPRRVVSQSFNCNL